MPAFLQFCPCSCGISSFSQKSSHLWSKEMVVCYQNCSDLLWEKIVLKASEFFCTWHDVSSQKQHTLHFSELTFATLNITFSGICFFTRTGSPIWLWNGFSSCCELGSTPTGFCTSWVSTPAGPLTVHWNDIWLVYYMKKKYSEGLKVFLLQT